MSRLTIILLLAVSVTIFAAELYEPMQPPFVTWIDDGRAEASIVTDEFDEQGTQPAQLLNEYLQKMSGAKLPVVDAPAGGPTVFIGPKAGLARLDNAETFDPGDEGFIITNQGDDLIIAGKDRLSTLYGVCAFLEECLGVRWVWAGKSGECVPENPTVKVGRVHKVQKPAFAFRWIGRGDWGMKNRTNVHINEPGEFKTKWFVHTFLDLVPPEEYWPEHKEYYALRNGKRVDPTKNRRTQLCTSNPDVVDAVAKTVDRIMEKESNTCMISIDPEDGQRFCQCENCEALDEKNTQYARDNSRRLAIFYNQVAEKVAKKHPDLLLKSIAYHTYVAPPKDPDITMHDNVVIQFCRFQCHNHALDDPDCPINSEFNKYFRGWNKITSHVIFYEYYYKVSWLHLPWPIIHMLADDIPYLHDHGLMGISTQYTHNFASNGLAYYLAAKLLWKPELDVDALVEDFCNKAYGAAAGPMLNYHNRLEKAAIESGVHLAGQRPYADVLRVFTPEVVAELDGYIKKALQAAEDQKARERVQLMATGLEYTHLVVDYLRTIEQAVAEAPATPWRGELSETAIAEATDDIRARAEKIRQFIKNEKGPAVGTVNNYIERLLNPRAVAQNWRSGSGHRGQVRLTKTGWLAEHEGWQPPQLPEKIDLWIYGNDLDYRDGKPEHNILAVADDDGEEKVIGRVGTKKRGGNRQNRGYVLKNIDSRFFKDGTVDLIVTNPTGGPFASHFYAFYAMPGGERNAERVTEMIQENLDAVRENAIGFTEYSYRGFNCGDGDRDRVAVKLHTRNSAQ